MAITNRRALRWHDRFLDAAIFFAGWSKDPSTQCGAVIVRPDRTIASIGFNGFPKNTSDARVLYEDREEKLARVVHAELNAILFARELLHGYTIYTAQVPQIGHSCARCAAHIIQSGIMRVVSFKSEPPERWLKDINRAEAMYHEAGIELLLLDR